MRLDPGADPRAGVGQDRFAQGRFGDLFLRLREEAFARALDGGAHGIHDDASGRGGFLGLQVAQELVHGARQMVASLGTAEGKGGLIVVRSGRPAVASVSAGAGA